MEIYLISGMIPFTADGTYKRNFPLFGQFGEL